MFRPLAWIVLSLVMLAFWAGRMLADSDPQPAPVVPAVVTSPVLAPDGESAPLPSPFAYVREDGSQEFVPATGTASPGASFEDTHALQFQRSAPAVRETEAAVYTWSSPAT